MDEDGGGVGERERERGGGGVLNHWFLKPYCGINRVYTWNKRAKGIPEKIFIMSRLKHYNRLYDLLGQYGHTRLYSYGTQFELSNSGPGSELV